MSAVPKTDTELAGDWAMKAIEELERAAAAMNTRIELITADLRDLADLIRRLRG